jgi:hypothetical protein
MIEFDPADYFVVVIEGFLVLVLIPLAVVMFPFY